MGPFHQMRLTPPSMNTPSAIHLHIEHIVIDEAVHRAGPEAVRAALEAQLPSLLAAGTGGACRTGALPKVTTEHIVERVRSTGSPHRP